MCIYVYMYICIYVYMHICMYVCTYVCMYVCMYVRIAKLGKIHIKSGARLMCRSEHLE